MTILYRKNIRITLLAISMSAAYAFGAVVSTSTGAGSAEEKALAAASVAVAGVAKVQAFKSFFAVLSTATKKDLIDKGAQEFKTVILQPATTDVSLTIESLEEIKAVAEAGAATLRLSAAKDITVFNDLLKILTARLSRQKDFMISLSIARALADTPIEEKIKKYDAILGSLSSDMLAATKQTLIVDLKQFFATAQKQGAKQFDAVKKLIVKAPTLAGFTTAERQQFADILTSAQVHAAGVLTPVAGKNTELSKSFAEKLKELAVGSISVKKRCEILQELAAFIKADSLPADKNQLVTQANQLYMLQSTMTIAEINDVLACFQKFLGQQALLTPDQRIILEGWIKNLGLAKANIEGKKTLLESVKAALSNAKKEVNATVKIIPVALMLLGTNLPKEELNKTSPTSLIALLIASLPVVYSSRSIRDLAYLEKIKNVLLLAQQNQLTKDGVRPVWLENCAFLGKMGAGLQEGTLLKRIETYNSCLADIKPTTDVFEKGIFVNALVTLYANRYDRAQVELEALLQLVQNCLNPKVKSFFTSREHVLFTSWIAPLKLLIGLLIAQQKTVIKEFSFVLKDILPSLAGAGVARERGMFVAMLNSFFLQRGKLQSQDLAEIVILLKQIRPQNDQAAAAQKILSNNQAKVVDQWLVELEAAKELVPAGVMYADALLKVAREKADLAMYKKLLNVFTDSSIATLPRVNGFIDGINKIIQTKETSSMSELKALLSLLKQKKIGANYLLTDEQRRIVGLWESSIS
jgi:hypothetical protein